MLFGSKCQGFCATLKFSVNGKIFYVLPTGGYWKLRAEPIKAMNIFTNILLKVEILQATKSLGGKPPLFCL